MAGTVRKSRPSPTTNPRALIRFLCLAGAASLPLEVKNSQTNWLSDLDLAQMRQGWGTPRVNQSVTGKALVIGGVQFEHGAGTPPRAVAPPVEPAEVLTP